MQDIESFKDLIVWQRSIQLTVALYKLTAGFPPDERFGLTNQLRRAGVSVASNIAAGYGRLSTGEYKHFLGMARGSNCEVQTQLVIARELGFGDSERLGVAQGLSEEVARMLVWASAKTLGSAFTAPIPYSLLPIPCSPPCS